MQVCIVIYQIVLNYVNHVISFIAIAFHTQGTFVNIFPVHLMSKEMSAGILLIGDLMSYLITLSTYSGNGVCLTIKEAALLTYNQQKELANFVYTTPWDAE
jgi:hypothetical protein